MMYQMNKNELPTSRLSKVIVLQTYKQKHTNIHHQNYTTNTASWVVNNNNNNYDVTYRSTHKLIAAS